MSSTSPPRGGTDGPARSASPSSLPPKLAEGVELIGESAGSGYKKPPSLARRGDGQVIQLTRLLYLVAEAADGSRDEGELVAGTTDRLLRHLQVEIVIKPDADQEQLRSALGNLVGTRLQLSLTSAT